jgi:predicted 3-demethylubiquinone-9 3-methyltransferase (glyoxalase superfamily)
MAATQTIRGKHMKAIQGITPCLWFDDQAEAAAEFYTAVFNNSRITNITRYSEVGHEIHGKPAGSVMTIEFELDGHPFTALNGGPIFKFNEAISFQVICETQDEVDYFWDRLSEGGDVNAQQCGWLKDSYGVSWQVIPAGWFKLLSDPESAGARRAMAAMFEMKKLDIAKLEEAYAG